MSLDGRTVSLLGNALGDYQAGRAVSDAINAAALDGPGTVTGASVVTINGFAGTVANPSTTPAFTIKTTVTGILHGNGTAVAAVTPQSASVPVAVTFTAGGTPTVYTTPSGALTVAHSDIPTVVELLAYCNELRGNILELQAILTALGLST